MEEEGRNEGREEEGREGGCEVGSGKAIGEEERIVEERKGEANESKGE